MFGLGTSWFHRTGRTLNVIGKRKYYYLLSLILIVPGMVVLVTSGFNKGIEFKSGTLVTATFQKNVTVPQVQKIVEEQGVENTVQISDGKTAFITTELIPGSKKTGKEDTAKLANVQKALTEEIGPFKSSTEEVGATISKELTYKAFLAVILASALIILYLSFRFAIGGFVSGLKYGVCAVVALIHDTMFIAGSFAIFGKVFGWQIDSLFVTAVLTIIGFSVHDTIVVYDRIRENLRNRSRGEDFETIANNSILQTFSRSINTSMTVLITLGSLLLLGGPILKHFYLALFMGIIIGTYSSIFNATPLVVDWERLFGKSREPKKPTEGKALVNADTVRFTETPKPERAEATEQASVAANSDRIRVKPKKKKKRF
jgi:preprotein translocase SecF subunit